MNRIFNCFALFLGLLYAGKSLGLTLNMMRKSKTVSARVNTMLKGHDSFSTPESSLSSIQKNVKNSLLASSLLMLTVVTNARPSAAKVYFDTDVYGDKELKIATTNKIKQKLRNAILADNSIAPLFLQLAINDALGYDASSLAGGPDGSVGLFEMDRDMNKDLSRAVDVIKGIMGELKRTNTVGFADLVSFAGAEALETSGCERIIVQVGRFDATGANPKTTGVNWSAPGSPEEVLNSFHSSGLDAKDTVLLLGALGEMKRIVKETADATSNGNKDDDDDDDADEADSWQTNVPSTFGNRSQIYGKQLGKHDFGNKYFASLLKQGPRPDDSLGKALLADAKTKQFVQKYASQTGGESAFLIDLPIAYNKMTILGQAFTTRNS